MAKGNKIIPFRVDPVLELDMKAAIRSRNERTREEPWTMSDFIKVAIREKLAHMLRSQRSRRSKKGSGS